MAIGAGIPIRRDGRLVGVADSSNRLPFRVVGGRGVRLPLDGTGELVRVEPFRDRNGLDWQIVVTMPESEFEGPLRRDALNNLLISLGAVGVSGSLRMQAVRRVNASLTQVVEGSEALAEGNLDHEVPPGEVTETQRVATSLNTMAPP